MKNLSPIALLYIMLLGCGKDNSNPICPEEKCLGQNLIRLSPSATGYSFKLEDCKNIATPCEKFCSDHKYKKIDTVINDYHPLNVKK